MIWLLNLSEDVEVYALSRRKDKAKSFTQTVYFRVWDGILHFFYDCLPFKPLGLDTVQGWRCVRILSVERKLQERDKSLVTSVFSKRRSVLGMCFRPPPRCTERSELASAVVVHVSLWKYRSLPCAAGLCDCTRYMVTLILRV